MKNGAKPMIAIAQLTRKQDHFGANLRLSNQLLLRYDQQDQELIDGACHSFCCRFESILGGFDGGAKNFAGFTSNSLPFALKLTKPALTPLVVPCPNRHQATSHESLASAAQSTPAFGLSRLSILLGFRMRDFKKALCRLGKSLRCPR